MNAQLAIVPIGEVDWTDIFAGAGGSSLGIESVPGMVVTQALNHWDLAVEAHNANFPHADHDVHDVQEIPAARFRRTRCLWASPECTHHAYCRGPKANTPEAARSRSTFADIVRFTEHHRYDAIVVENVVEARLWCEAASRKHGWNPKLKEYRCSCGVDFDAWYAAMLALGYSARIVYFNSQFALASWPFETVIDPFAGSGNTLIAALRLQRRAIGIEQSAEWVALAEDRVARLAQLSLAGEDAA